MNRPDENRQTALGKNYLALGALMTAVTTILLLPIGPASAVTRIWNTGDGNWNVAGNWTPFGVPAAGDAVNIVFTDGVARTVTYNVSAPSLGLLTVDLTGPGATASTLSMSSNNSLAANGILIGGYNGITATPTAGRGAMTQSAGTTSTNSGWDFVLVLNQANSARQFAK